MSTTSADTFQQALARLEADGDAQPLVALFAEDSECDNLTHGSPERGRDGAERFWTQDRSLFASVSSDFRNVIDTGDRIVLEWTRTGTARDGGEVRYDGVSLIELRDGEIARFRAYFDPHEVGRQAVA
jgi:ketosteroid isomerase-like protein